MNIVRNNYYILLKTIPTLIFARFHDFILQNNMIGKHWNYFLSSRLCLHCSLHLKFLTHGWFHTSQNLYRYKYLKFTFHIIPIFLYFFLCHFIVSRKISIRFEWIDSAIGKLLKLLVIKILHAGNFGSIPGEFENYWYRLVRRTRLWT